MMLKLSRARQVSQIITFFLSNLGFVSTLKTGFCYPFLYCYGCPLASAGCPLGILQHFAIIPAIPIYLIGTLGLYGTMFGRAFCGWACPFGAFQDILGRVTRRKKTLRSIPYMKYVMLLLVIILAWATLDTFFCKFCPAGSLFAAIPAPFFYNSLNLGMYYYVHIVTLLLTISLVIVISRFWCRYLCPIATIGLFNKISLLNISLNRSKCQECLECLQICPMGINKLTAIGSSTDCTLCGKCVEVCKTGALKINFRRKNYEK